MKKILLALIGIAGAAQVSAQKLEVTAGVYGTTLQFAGKSTEATSFISYNNSGTGSISYTNNPYGSKRGYGYGAQAEVKILLASFIVGWQAGYERLSSKTDITSVTVSQTVGGVYTSQSYAATGKTNLDIDAINMSPFIGYRVPLPFIKLDVIGGLEMGVITSAKENGKAEAADGNTYTSDKDRRTIKQDTRIRYGLAANYYRLGAFAYESFGWSNYKDGYVGPGPHEAKSRVFRVGLSYLLN